MPAQSRRNVAGGCRRRWVLLDRDGTINVDRHYLSNSAGLELLQGVVEGLRRMQELGWGLIVVTNQSGVARGLISPEELEEIHRRLRQLLAEQGVLLDAIYVCPHGPDDGCACRKPGLGMAELAARDFGLTPAECTVIGDKLSDVELGVRFGGTAILVRTGEGRKSEESLRNPTAPRPHAVVDDLLQAADLLKQWDSAGADPALVE